MQNTSIACGGHIEGASDLRRFLRSWAADPLQVAAISPSGTALARLITREIDVHHAPVLELGPGTGVFTRALIDRGLAPADLTLVELGAEFAALLGDRFPGVRIVRADAARIVPQLLFPEQKAGAVISGLGLLSMPPRRVLAILANAFDCLRPDGYVYQFTYGPMCPVPRPILDRLGLKARRIGGTWRNLPPASVYRISRRGPLQRRAATKSLTHENA
ncbi:class I SAM-dependent methyltransferase [Pelagovum pacificum]|uniref:Methyltransferase domain-containing protein n=1 Tax=Pelagovum pacificum TaxID=2588711 RepID=A0A5C5GDF5_9RHOB|nr:methyltransferase domain-containing protein [Pelagovum pacificum]QQA41172.1 methyltransferase domain-containing protein [Pelagovum pacificum]TNY32019.1 methyltransferase domain-containing protein [Pelagovum pacificum]